MAILAATAFAAQAGSPAQIVGGDRVRPGQFTSIVALVLEPGRIIHCSGIVVGDRWVLTARHCLNAGTLRAVPGRDLRPMNKAFDVAQSFVHPSPERDVALLKLSEPITSSSVTIAPLSQSDPLLGDVITVVGWGYEDWARTSLPTRPKKVDVKVRYLSCFESPDLFCSLPVKEREGPNWGDSGGGCFRGSPTNPVVVGIQKGGNDAVPGSSVCEKASSVRGWVQSTMASH
jgi:hypothetical protein